MVDYQFSEYIAFFQIHSRNASNMATVEVSMVLVWAADKTSLKTA